MENNQLNNTNNHTEESNFDITLFLLDCLAQWKWFVLSIVVILGLSVFYVMRQVPTYRVESMILMIDKWSKTESDVLTKSLGITSGAENIYTEIEIMRSRSITKKVVKDLELYTSYSYKGQLRNTPLYNNTPSVVRPDSTTDIEQLKTAIKLVISKPNANNKYNIEVAYNIEEQEKKTSFIADALPYTLYLPTIGTFIIEPVTGYDTIERDLLVQINNPSTVASNISKKINLAQFEKNTHLISASYTTPLPQMGIDIINRMVYYYNEDGIAEKNRAANNTEAFINNRLIAIQQELSNVEEEVEKYRTQRGLTDLSSEAEMYLMKTGESDRERSKLDVQLSLIEYVESFLGDPQNTYAPIPILGINEGGLSNIINEYNKAIAEREKLLNTSSESNPVVKEFTQNILALKGNVLQGIAATRKSIELRKKDIARQDEENEQKIRKVLAMDYRAMGQRILGEFRAYIEKVNEENLKKATQKKPLKEKLI